MTISRRFTSLGYLVCALLLLTVASAGNASAEDGVPTLRVGLEAQTSNSEYLKLLLTYLEKETGARIVPLFTPTHAARVEDMVAGRIDIGFFGGVEFAQVSVRAGATPLMQSAHDQSYHTVFIARADSSIHSLKDINGHTFLFGAENSGSSRVIPEYWLHQAGVDQKVIDDALERMRRKPIENHQDANIYVALAVAHKEVDAAGVNQLDYDKLMKDGEITADQVRLIWTTPEYSNSVWAARKGFDAALSERFVNAFLKLDPQNPEHNAFLKLFRAANYKYVRANDSSFDIMRKAAKADGFLQ